MSSGRQHGRGPRSRAAAALLFVLSAFPAPAQHGSPQPHAGNLAPAGRPAPQNYSARPGDARSSDPRSADSRNPGQTAQRGQHLPEWMQAHQGLNPQQREQALRQEPGFNRLPEPQQQHLVDRLHKLDSAPPQVRQRTLQRNELFERMPPEQKQQVRAASQALSQMPPDRNMAVKHAFRDMRALNPADRANVLNSARFQAEFSPEERHVLGHLLSIEPYQP